VSRPVALVTGGRRGIGRAIAEALAAAGYDVAITDLAAPDEVGETLASLAIRGARVSYHRHDVSEAGSHAALVDNVVGQLGGIDCFVSNAGISSPVRGDLLDISPENFDRVLAVNLKGAALLSQAVARAMLARPARRGSIVFITSVSARLASPERAEYCVSKAALSMWASNLALRLAGEGIAVFEVQPGIIRTEMTSSVASAYETRISAGLVPARRWGESEDIGRIVAALAGGDFAFATGSVIAVDGALSVARL
jgi:NAD(P)-dependent dehydrogenase (short-subunit alcohol dehydrogenase family)